MSEPTTTSEQKARDEMYAAAYQAVRAVASMLFSAPLSKEAQEETEPGLGNLSTAKPSGDKVLIPPHSGHRLSREDGEQLEEIVEFLEARAKAPFCEDARHKQALFLRRLRSESGRDEYTELELVEEASRYLNALAAECQTMAEGGGGELPAAEQRALFGKADAYRDAVEYLRSNFGTASQPPQDDVERLREKLTKAVRNLPRSYPSTDDHGPLMEQGDSGEWLHIDAIQKAIDAPAPDVERLGGEPGREAVDRAWGESGRSALDELFEAITPRDGSMPDQFAAGMLASHAWAEVRRLRALASPSPERLGGEEAQCPCHAGREAAMVEAAPGAWCDPCIAPLVKALNDADLPTVASCCGHGKRPGKIALADRRELFIVPDFEAARELDILISANDRGDANPPPPQEHSRPKTCPRCGSQFPAVIAGPCAEDGVPSDNWHVEGLEALGRGCEECEDGICRDGAEWAPCPNCFPQQEHSKGGLEKMGTDTPEDLRRRAHEAPHPNQGSDQPKDQGGDALAHDAHPADDGAHVTRGGVDDGSAPETSEAPVTFETATPKGIADAIRQSGGPKDCGGSGEVKDDDCPGCLPNTCGGCETPCPGCTHPDCPNRDQAQISESEREILSLPGIELSAIRVAGALRITEDVALSWMRALAERGLLEQARLDFRVTEQGKAAIADQPKEEGR